MNKVIVEKVRTKKQIKEFINFPLKLYKGCKYFIPPLYGDEKALFTEKNIYKKTCISEFFIAYKDGKVVGRIQAIIQKQFTEIHGDFDLPCGAIHHQGYVHPAHLVVEGESYFQILTVGAVANIEFQEAV